MRSTAAPLSAAPPVISRGRLIRELSVFAKPSDKSGALLLLRDAALYWGLWAAVLFAPALGWKILASVLMGIRLTSMYTVAHDASHRTLFASRRWNWIAALALGVPSVQNYRMWTHDHNHVHHPRTNGDHFDFYRPFSKAEYDALSPLQQLAERLCRAPNVFGLFVYWLVRWIPTRVWPNPRTPVEQRGVSMAYAVPLMLFHGGMLAFLVFVAPRIAPIEAGTAVLLGWFGPLMLHFWISSATLYLMHTHPCIPWFKGNIARSGDYAPELCSTVLTTPDWFSKMVNNVYCHAAHHAHHGIPSYLLLPAQKRMNELLGNRLVVEPLSLFSMLRTLRTCKLYDFERHQWLDFDGRPTAPAINLSVRNAVPEQPAAAPQRQPQPQQPATA
jgi:omega-6 fatty acid desaturase (delta-12 desaturase)